MKRDSRFEALRIFSMFLIIIYHYSLYGNWKHLASSNQFAIPLGQIGVCLFVFISGYFLSGEKFVLKKQIKRICKLWIWVLTYSWIILGITYIFKINRISLKLLVYSIFPILFNYYWFVTSFIVLMFLMPLLNKLIRISSQKQLFTCTLFFMVTSGVLPVLNNMLSPFGEGHDVGIMITCYLAAAYIRIYKVEIKNLYLLGIVFLSLLAMYVPLMLRNNNRLCIGILPLITATSLFILLTRTKKYYNSVINFMASSVFASYLVTENGLLRIPIWHRLFNVNQYSAHPIIAGILITTVVIVVTVLLDKLYKLLYKLILGKVVCIISNIVYRQVNRLKQNEFFL